jgi:hypothetical protein
MVRRLLYGSLFFTGLVLLASALQTQPSHAHGPGCNHADGSCDQDSAPSRQAPSGFNVAPQRGMANQGLPYQGTPQAQFMPNQGVGYQGDDCPICRGEQQRAFTAAPNGFDPNIGRSIEMPSNPMPGPLGRPRMNSNAINPYAFEPYTSGQYPNGQMPRALPRDQGPIDLEPMPNVRDMTPPQAGFSPRQDQIPEGMALVLQNDSPLMNAAEQLGSIDRGQTLRVLNIQGNWVQLDTDWLGKNAWIRSNHVRMNDNIQPPNDIAPPAT